MTKYKKNDLKEVTFNCYDPLSGIDYMSPSLNIPYTENGYIIDSKFKTFGCGSAIASSSLVTEWLQDKHIDDAYAITNKEIAEELKLPPVKLHCSMLAQDAVQSAIEDYINKNNPDDIIF